MAISHIYNKAPKRSAPAPASNRWRILAAVAVLVAVAGFAFYWLHNDGTVTLNVKGADIQDVVKKIARQSGKEILISPNASGTVTLNIRKKSVADALEALSVQAGGSWHEFYAVAPSKDEIENFKNSQREGGGAEGWTRATNPFGGFGGRRMALGGSRKEVTYSTAATPARDVALALTYRMTGEVAVADTFADQPVTIALEKREPERAASEFAERLNGKLDHFFLLRTGNRNAGAGQQNPEGQQGNTPPPPPWMTGGRQGQGRGQNAQRPSAGGTATPNANETATQPTTGAENNSSTPPTANASQQSAAPPTGTATTGASARNANSSTPRPPRMMMGGFGRVGEQMTPEQQADAEREWQRQLTAMTPEQRSQMEDIGNQMRNAKSPQEAMQAIQNYLNKNPQIIDQGKEMMLERLKSSTPEQRNDFYKQMNQMRKQMQQFQQNSTSPTPTIPPPANP